MATVMVSVLILVALSGSLEVVRGSGAAIADAGPSAVAAAGGSINRATRVNTHRTDNPRAAGKGASVALPSAGAARATGTAAGIARTAGTAGRSAGVAEILETAGIAGTAGAADNVSPFELDALRSLYDTTDGPNWLWEELSPGRAEWNFAAGANPCIELWQGVTCGGCNSSSSEQCFVSILNLAAFNLVGTLPAALGNLMQAERLVLDTNALTGSLPAELGTMASLQFLSLYSNALTGSLPAELGNMTSLRYLSLSSNALTGSLPAELGTLASLQYLSLYSNALTGSLPAELGTLANLRYLSLYSNALTGSLPAELGTLASLQYLYLSFNALTGSLPAELGNMASLNSLILYNNSLSGSLPAELGDMASLQYLYLFSNSLTGSLPAELGTMASLQYLYLYSNSLTGSLPAELGDMASLQYLYLFSNSLTGSLPAELGDMASLNSLILYNNSLSGSLPAELGDMSSLQSLDCNSNSLSGTIPPELGNLASLQFLNLFNNSLVGTVPTTFSALTNLKYLQLLDNLLSGSLQGVFDAENQADLQVINLSDNAFSGEIPEEIFELPALQRFLAVSNCLSGSAQLLQSVCQAGSLITLAVDGMHTAAACRASLLPGMPWGMSDAYTSAAAYASSVPPCLLQMPNITTLHLSGIGISGVIPNVRISPALLDLSLSHNTLSGSIPQTLQLRAWASLDLSYNRLQGELSGQFGKTSASTDNQTLALENNRLSGRVPSPFRPRTSIAVLRGNLFECDSSRADLPPHDPYYKIFQCGSTDVEVPYYTWLALMVAALAALVIVWVRGGALLALAQRTLHLDELEFLADSARNKHLASVNGVPLVAPLHTQDVFLISRRLCLIAAVCALFALLVLMPLYAAMSTQYGTHEHSYMWTVAAVFTSGEVPVATELPAVVVLLVLILAAFRWCLDATSHKPVQSSSSNHTITSGAESLASIAALAGGVSLAESAVSVTSGDEEGEEDGEGKEDGGWKEEGEREEEGGEEGTIPLLRRVSFFSGLVAVNLFVVVGVNTAFVSVLLYESSGVAAFAQLALSLFKIVWNLGISPLLARWVTCKTAGRESPSPSTCEVKSDLFYLQLVMAVLSNIVIPCLTVAAIDPNCFNGAFHQASSVDAQYTYDECFLFEAENAQCASEDLQTRTTAYQPPFTYSYQCGAGLVTSYSPTFLYMCIIASFVEPLQQLLLSELLARTHPGTRLHQCICWAVPRQLRPLLGKEDRVQGSIMHPFFDADRLLLAQLTYLSILVTFGSAFPPLSAALALAMVATHHFARYKLGRFLRMAYEQRLFRCIQIVEAESAAAGSITALSQSRWMLVLVCALFFSLLLFDTLGDKRGLQGSYWILIVLPLLPACLYAGHLLLPESVGRAGAGAGVGVGAVGAHPFGVELVERGARQEGSELDYGAGGTGGTGVEAIQQLQGRKEGEGGGGREETHNALHSKV